MLHIPFFVVVVCLPLSFILRNTFPSALPSFSNGREGPSPTAITPIIVFIITGASVPFLRVGEALSLLSDLQVVRKLVEMVKHKK